MQIQKTVVLEGLPTGMYANLGYIYLKGGKTDKAIENFKKEKSIYPGSSSILWTE
ncbi:MAG: DUF4810 domain-containing protein [Sulfurimonas sp.]|nr:DUF4810 domain-containing protein [Sulfurimonas sp.]